MPHDFAAPTEEAPNRACVSGDPSTTFQTPPSLSEQCSELITVLDNFPQQSPSHPSASRVLRVRTRYFAQHTRDEAELNAKMLAHLKDTLGHADDPGMVVVYEADRCFRVAFRNLQKDKTFEFRANRDRHIVVSLDDDIDVELLRAAVRLFHGTDPCPRNVVVLLTAVGLRNRGCNIVQDGSIEQTVREFVAHTRRSLLADVLSLADHLIVIFEETGAVYIRRDRRQRLHGSIHFCPNFDWVAQMDRDRYGTIPGRRAIVLTAIVKQIEAEMRQSAGRVLDLADGVRLGLVTYNFYFKQGFSATEDPFDTLRNALGHVRQAELRSILDGSAKKKPDRELLVSSLEFPTDDRLDRWSRVRAVPSATSLEQLPLLLRKIVQLGPEKPFREEPAPTVVRSTEPGRWFPSSTIQCPYFQIGKLKTVDPDEIKGFLALGNLVRKYLEDRTWSPPLSIAVFGPPGSGKNFAVKELLKTVNPTSKDSPTLTFNLAQFDSVELLTEAFHRVQDRALNSSDVPLVIFDEFDSNFREPLGWLKYFPAPMEDGAFRGKSTDYKVGRAIFVFAGTPPTTSRRPGRPMAGW